MYIESTASPIRDGSGAVSGGVLDPTNKKGYSQNWNLTFEQQIGKDLSLSIAYVGNKGTRVPRFIEGNLDQALAAAKRVLAEVTLRQLFEAPSVPYEQDEVTRVCVDVFCLGETVAVPLFSRLPTPAPPDTMMLRRALTHISSN